jgi:hypothetical protein
MTNTTNERPVSPLSASEQAAYDRGVERAPDPGPSEAASGNPPMDPSVQGDGKAMALLDNAETGALRSRWAVIQASFVDEPRSAVQQGDALVAEVTQRLVEVFAAERARLEEQWSSGSDVSTEDLRLALRRYRSFFDRLLTM